MKTIKIASCNFENNGGGDPLLWQRMHERLKTLDLHLLLRQEMWDAAAEEERLAKDAAALLGMEYLLGERSCTAVYYRPDFFACSRRWTGTGPMWVLPPTVANLRLHGTGPSAAPLVVGSYHLNYASTTTRLAEAEWLTTWNDKWQQAGQGELMHLPALLGGDNNSYPAPGVPHDPALPVLAEIADLPHRVHRSFIAADGTRSQDVRPDETLRGTGLQDVARHFALHPATDPAAARAATAPTVDASRTHAGASRIDRIYASGELLAAVHSVEVIDMRGLSDHHTVLLRLDADVLADVLNEPVTRSSDWRLASA
ncbi:endonuclease/exonuclease/phosphatase family protein [Streptacidiphilus sp. MAP5-52]|uniref:endonuclease/exonuclease/phosphatase family protein n=1 Tax=Streptacidiphilus sp. MAP5-52 TaxID=3156267 RepID=UPI0035180710